VTPMPPEQANIGLPFSPVFFTVLGDWSQGSPDWSFLVTCFHLAVTAVSFHRPLVSVRLVLRNSDLHPAFDP